MSDYKIRLILKKLRRALSEHVIKHNWYVCSRELDTMCGISSYLIFNTFKKLGYNPIFCMNDEHCFIKLNGKIIDLTLKQFNKNYPAVMFRKTPTRYHKIQRQAKYISRIKRLFKPWPDDQNPFKQKLPKIGNNKLENI